MSKNQLFVAKNKVEMLRVRTQITIFAAVFVRICFLIL